ncbi:M16 family metallopeptidase [Corallococcus terminator]|uniref:Insulinase family protein n=1 Tax=Corallococcus terminator TaxID=2316733 RepID=A0A3A8JB33_9BACT|nr:pitrilysin family protein [Corallococcus terminator]RKG87671.1 insulinase family protein [Corallococcus terminator]
MLKSNPSVSLVFAAALSFAGCASTPKPMPEAAPPTTPPAATDSVKSDAPVPAVPLKQPKPMELVVQARQDTPLVSLRLVFHTGSIDDPKGKEGLTSLTAKLMAEGGTRKLTAAQLLEALYPMAAELKVFTDKEMTTLSGRVHQDFLPRFLELYTDTLLEPRFDPAEFERLRANALNAVRNGLRSEDDETLGKVGLDALLYAGHPYAHFTGGTVQGLQSLTLEDVKAHARRVFTQDRLVIGLAGPVDATLQQTVTSRLSALPATGAPRVALPAVPSSAGRTLILQKPTLSTAVSMGFVTPMRRGDPDFFPVAFALSNLGEHRQFVGMLFNELREQRGLNYGDYAYAEHFIEDRGNGTFNRTNLVRTQQDVSVWLRPVVPTNAVFATRGAVYFLDQMSKQPLSQERFDLVRGFLQGYTRLWEQSDQRRLGYAIDSLFYGTPNFLESYREALKTMTPESVNAAVRRQLQPEKLAFVFVTEDADGLAKTLKSGAPSPITYASPKPPELLKLDETLIQQKLPVRPDAVQVAPASEFMER